jgi:hypothetical protein
MKPRDYIDTHIDLRRRVRQLELKNLWETDHTGFPARLVDPVAEWLCYRAPYPTDRYAPSQQAWRLIEAEEASTDNDLLRSIRAAREDLGLIPKVASALDSLVLWAGDPHRAIPIIVQSGFVTGNNFSSAQASLRGKLYARCGGWMYPIVLPGRPTYHPVHWLGGVGGTSGEERYVGFSYSGAGLTSQNGPLDIALAYHSKDSGWTFPDGGGIAGIGDILAWHDTLNVNPNDEFGFMRGPSHFYSPIFDAENHIIGYQETATYQEYGEDPINFADVLKGDYGPGNDFQAPRLRSRSYMTTGFGSEEDGYIEESIAASRSTIYLLAKDVRAWGPPITIADFVAQDGDFGGGPFTTHALASLNPVDPDWSYDTIPAFVDVAAGASAALGAHDLDGWVGDRLGETQSPYDQQGWTTLDPTPVSENTPSQITRAWSLTRYGWVQLRGWIQRTHLSGTAQLSTAPLPGDPIDGASFFLAGEGSASEFHGSIQTFGSAKILIVDNVEVGDRVFLDGLTYPTT